MFLLNLLFGENYCNLNCDYCAYGKKSSALLKKDQLLRMRSNIANLRNFSDKFISNFKILSITGGEPLLHYPAVKILLELFFDKNIRISTNGLVISKIDLGPVINHGKVYFAVSLDGHTLAMNSARIKQQEVLNKVFENINILLEKNIPVELLTTLHSGNIDGFFDFSSFVSKKYQSWIEEGKLWLLASPVVDRSLDKHFTPSEDQKTTFINNYRKFSKNLVLFKAFRYYENLCKFYNGQNRERCNMYDWSFDAKYLGDNLWGSGKFLLYGCGSSGLKILGSVDLESPLEDKIIWERINSDRLKKYFVNKCDYCKKSCFNNWHFYDLYLKDKTIGRDNIILRNYAKN